MCIVYTTTRLCGTFTIQQEENLCRWSLSVRFGLTVVCVRWDLRRDSDKGNGRAPDRSSVRAYTQNAGLFPSLSLSSFLSFCISLALSLPLSNYHLSLYLHCSKSFGGFCSVWLTMLLQSSICDVKFSQTEGNGGQFRQIEQSNSMLNCLTVYLPIWVTWTRVYTAHRFLALKPGLAWPIRKNTGHFSLHTVQCTVCSIIIHTYPVICTYTLYCKKWEPTQFKAACLSPRG